MKTCYLSQRSTDLPAGLDWLSEAEAEVYEKLSFPKRRDDWLLGRWTAKNLLNRLSHLPERPLNDWQILAGDDGAPRVWLDGKRVDTSISISHSDPFALCAAAGREQRLGCDIERVGIRSKMFEETYFTNSEIGLLNENEIKERPALVTLLWSAKESVLKALHLGLKADTRRIVVTRFDKAPLRGWSRIEAEDTELGKYHHGWWRDRYGMIATMFSDNLTMPLRMERATLEPGAAEELTNA